MAEAEREIPRVVTVFILALGTAAVAATSADVVLNGLPMMPGPAVAAGFLGLLLAAGVLMVRFQHSRQVEALDLFEAVLVPALFAMAGPVVVCLVVAAKIVTERVRRNQPVKAAFNVAQFAAMTGAASLVFHSLRIGSRPTGRNITALVVAMMAMFVVNKVALVGVIHLAERAPVRAILRGMAPVVVPGWLAGWTVNVAFGLLFLLAYEWSAWALGLAAVPLVTLHLAYRGYATALADRARLDGMHRASGALAGPIDSREAIPGFLDEVRAAFQCRAAELVLVSGDALVTYRSRDGHRTQAVVGDGDEPTVAAALLRLGHPVRITDDADGEAAAKLRAFGHRDCMAAPLTDDGRTVGVLATFDHRGPEGFEAGALTILAALASEAAAALKKSELLEAILEERRKLADIVMHTSDGIFTVGRGGHILTWNPGMAAISGYDADEMTAGRLFPLLQAKTPDGTLLTLESLLSSSEETGEEVQITTRSGEVRWLACSYSAVREPDGRVQAVVVVARDFTRAREVEQLKDDFIATVSHELRTPLTPIKGWAATLERVGAEIDPAARLQIARSIGRQADRLERLIMNLLQVAQIERRTVDVRDTVVDVTNVAAKIVDELRIARPGRDIRLTAPAGPCRARGDETSVEQILSNLLSNALKYAPADEPIDVVVRHAPGTTEIDVIDRGPGIAAGDAERIFQRFERLGHHMTREQEGAGLGLYIARNLAQTMGASIDVTTAPGAGATFTLTLRAVPTLVAVG